MESLDSPWLALPLLLLTLPLARRWRDLQSNRSKGCERLVYSANVNAQLVSPGSNGASMGQSPSQVEDLQSKRQHPNQAENAVDVCAEPGLQRSPVVRRDGHAKRDDGKD